MRLFSLSRVRNSFTPKEAVGVHFDGEIFRIVRIRKNGPELEVVDTFQGNKSEAEAYASRSGLKWEGVGLCFDEPFVHIANAGGDEDSLLNAEKSLPVGLKSE